MKNSPFEGWGGSETPFARVARLSGGENPFSLMWEKIIPLSFLDAWRTFIDLLKGQEQTSLTRPLALSFLCSVVRFTFIHFTVNVMTSVS